jgi:Ni,Fe-hydrogenase III large subunit
MLLRGFRSRTESSLSARVQFEVDLAVPLGELCASVDAIALVEGWRGPLWYWVTAEGSASLARVKVVDPSFGNWPVQSLVLRGGSVSCDRG